MTYAVAELAEFRVAEVWRLQLRIFLENSVFKGLGNLAKLGNVLQQAQQLGTRLQSLNEELRARRATGSAGAGLVEIEVNGLAEILRVRIDPSLLARGDREMLEDLLLAAVNQALAKARQLHANLVKDMTSGMSLPGLDEALSKLAGADEPSEQI